MDKFRIMGKIDVAIVDDHDLFRKGFRSLLEKIDVVNSIIEASNGVELLEKLETTKVDLILTDIKMPEMNGIELTKFIKTHYPQIYVIVVTMYEDDDFIIDVIKRGANGYLSKQSSPEEVKTAIDTVLKDCYYFNDAVTSALIKGIKNKNNKKQPSATKNRVAFTDKELTILNLICQEYTNQEIGEVLDLSPKTIEGYKTRLLEKTGAKTSVGLAIFAIKNGYVKI